MSDASSTATDTHDDRDAGSDADADTPELSSVQHGKVKVSPGEFRLIKYDADTIAALVAEMAERLGVVNPIHLIVDETTALAKLSATMEDTSSDATITINAQSGALENSQRLTTFGEDACRESVGRMLLKAQDRMRDDFADAPGDLELTLEQNAAWDAYCVGRLARTGLPINQQRFRYNFRNRFGFSDASDSRFDEIWAADDLGFAELTAALG